MNYYIENTKDNTVMDLTKNKRLEGRNKNLYASVAHVLSHAWQTYGKINMSKGSIDAPEEYVHIYYSEGWIDIKKIERNYGCRFMLHKSKPIIQQHKQLSFFKEGA